MKINNLEINTIQYYAKDSGTVVYRDIATIGYLFYNSGNCNVTINNLLLTPGATFKTLETGYKDTTQWRLNFNQFNSCATDNAELTVLVYSHKD